MDLAFAKGLKMRQFPLMGRAIQTPLPHEVPFQAAFSVTKGDSDVLSIAIASNDF